MYRFKIVTLDFFCGMHSLHIFKVFLDWFYIFFFFYSHCGYYYSCRTVLKDILIILLNYINFILFLTVVGPNPWMIFSGYLLSPF